MERNPARTLINFEYNPNVAPTEQVPGFLAERGQPLATKMARFGINLPSSDGKKRPRLLNARIVCTENPVRIDLVTESPNV